MLLHNTFKVFSLSLLSLSFIFVTACDGKNEDSLTPFKKSNRSSNKTNEKPDKKAIQEALTAGLLVTIDSDNGTKSILKSATEEAAAFKAQLKINGKTNLSWDRTFKLKKGETLEPVALDDSHGLSDLKLSLTVAAKRIANTDKKGDYGYLVLTYELKHMGDDQDQSKSSLLLVLLDLKRIKAAKVILKNEVIFPVPENFSLKEWIDKQIKQP